MSRTFETRTLDNSDENRLTGLDNNATDSPEPSESPPGFAGVAATSNLGTVKPYATLLASAAAERTAIDGASSFDAAAIDAQAVVDGLLHAL